MILPDPSNPASREAAEGDHPKPGARGLCHPQDRSLAPELQLRVLAPSPSSGRSLSPHLGGQGQAQAQGQRQGLAGAVGRDTQGHG